MSDVQKVLAEGGGDGIRSVGGADLLQDGADVVIDAVLTDAEQPGDVAVGEATHPGGEDVALARGQLRDRRIGGELLAEILGTGTPFKVEWYLELLND